MTDAEIMAWLIENHEDYEKSTDATRENMRIGWQEMLDDMRGRTQTYWDEVDEIISRGDDAIIEFLKQHTADYQEAGALQAQAYVDEWKKKLEDLAKQLNARKKLNEEEDRAKKLAELEAQLARVSADPTRKKEALDLQEQISELAGNFVAVT